MLSQLARMCGLALAMWTSTALAAQAQSETFTATATVKTAGGASATSPITIVVDRKMPQAEVDRYLAIFNSGGAAALRKALAGAAATGSVRVAGGPATPTRLTLERPTDQGRLLTIVTDTPVVFLGAGVAGAKPREGYDFAIIDLALDKAGSGSGTFAPAAKVTALHGAFVVDDYSGEILNLTGVSRK